MKDIQNEGESGGWCGKRCVALLFRSCCFVLFLPLTDVGIVCGVFSHPLELSSCDPQHNVTGTFINVIRFRSEIASATVKLARSQSGVRR